MAPRRSGPLAHLDKDGPKPIYAVDGEDIMLVDEAVAAIKARSLPTTAVDFNFDIFIGKDVTGSRIAEAARMLPAFAERRLVIVKDADKLRESSLEQLMPYVADPSPTTVLLFVAAKFDGRTKFYKALKKAGAAIRLKHPSPREMPRILRERAQHAGVTLDDEAARLLEESVGTDVSALVAGLEKLALYVGPGNRRTVNRTDVETVVSYVREDPVFDLSDAIGARSTADALRLMHGMLESSRGHPLALLGLIAGHWRSLIIVRALMDSDAPYREIKSALGSRAFLADKLQRQVRRQTVADLVVGLRAIAAADRGLKGGKLPATRVMERLVLHLTG